MGIVRPTLTTAKLLACCTLVRTFPVPCQFVPATASFVDVVFIFVNFVFVFFVVIVVIIIVVVLLAFPLPNVFALVNQLFEAVH